MNVWMQLLFALGLAADAFAVALGVGAAGTVRQHGVLALRVGVSFGMFHGIMPALGWAAGVAVLPLIAIWDHWVCFLVLAAIGGRMILQAIRPEPESLRSTGHLALLALAVATSIDTFAAGIGVSTLEGSILGPALVVAAVTFVLAAAGVLAGHRANASLGRRTEALGGVVLIGIGTRILVHHLSA